MWSQLEPTGPHLAYILLPFFLISYALFSLFIRNRLHLSEPPLAALFGILIGPYVLGLVKPRSWNLDDGSMMEITRIVAGTQCFVVGIELPRKYLKRHWRSVLMLLGPVMTFGWLVCAGLVAAIFQVDFPTALLVAACLTPTDPVLSASVMGGSSFSESVPTRIKDLLKAESASNDGFGYPFVYVGISLLTRSDLAGFMTRWAVLTVLYQCVLGVVVGAVIGKTASRVMHFSEKRNFMGRSSYLMFYLLLSFFSVGVASTLGLDDFLVNFAAGVAFAQSDTFWERVEASRLPSVVEILLNSAMFIYFGTEIPWHLFIKADALYYMPGRLTLFLFLVLLFRRLPIVLLLKSYIPDVRTWGEAIFVGHFGPMGVASIFLALESRAQLETDTSIPLPDTPKEPNDLGFERNRAIRIVWPIVCFVVFGSIMVHGMSTLAISTVGRFVRRSKSGETSPLLGGSGGTNDEDGDRLPDSFA